MKRKIWTAILTGVLCLSMLAACGKQDSKEQSGKEVTESSSGDVTIRVMSCGAGTWDTAFPKMVEEYEKQNPGIHVEVEFYQQEQLFEAIEVVLGSKSDEFDIIMVDVPMVAGYANRGYLLPLDDYFTEDEKNEYVDSARNAGTWDGKFYAPAMNNSAQLLWYNTAYLKEAGFEIPSGRLDKRLSFEEVLDMAEKTQKVVDPDGTKGVAGFMLEQVSRAYQVLELPNSMGAPSIGEDGLNVEGVIDSAEWIQAMNFYRNLFETGVSTRGTTNDETGDNFLAGKIVFMIAGTWTDANAKEAGFSDYGYALCPYFEGHEDQVGTPTGSWHCGVSSYSSHPKEAADFIKYFTLGEGTSWVDEVGDVPATKAGVNKILTGGTDDVMKLAAYEAENTAVARPVTPAYTEYETAMNTMFEDIRNGAPVESSIQNTITQLNTAFAKYKEN